MDQNSHFRERITEITRRRVGDVERNPRNPKRYTEEKQKRLTAVLNQFGKAGVLLTYIDPDGVERFMDGNTRRGLGDDEVWYIAQTDLTQKEVDDLVMLYDPLALPDWEAELAKVLVEETAVAEPELEKMLAEVMEGLAAELAIEPPEAKDAGPSATEAEADKYQKIWQVKEGQIWQVGRHRIACIDCLDETAVLSFLDGVRVDFAWNDPPYGIDIVAANVSVGGGEAYDIPFGGVRKIRGDVGGTAAHMRKTGMSYMESNKQKKSRLGSVGAAKPFGSSGSAVRGSDGAANIIDVGKYAPVIGDDTTETAVKSSAFCLAHFPDAIQVWWGGNYYASALPDSPCWLIWDKENTGDFADCELAWTNHGGAARIFHHMWNGMVKASEHGQRRVHPTQKPVALARWAFEKYGDGGDVILDLFLGSGISVKAAEDLDDGRIVYGCDLAPAYIATVLQWASDRGITPELITETAVSPPTPTEAAA